MQSGVEGMAWVGFCGRRSDGVDESVRVWCLYKIAQIRLSARLSEVAVITTAWWRIMRDDLIKPDNGTIPFLSV